MGHAFAAGLVALSAAVMMQGCASRGGGDVDVCAGLTGDAAKCVGGVGGDPISYANQCGLTGDPGFGGTMVSMTVRKLSPTRSTYRVAVVCAGASACSAAQASYAEIDGVTVSCFGQQFVRLR